MLTDVQKRLVQIAHERAQGNTAGSTGLELALDGQGKSSYASSSSRSGGAKRKRAKAAKRADSKASSVRGVSSNPAIPLQGQQYNQPIVIGATGPAPGSSGGGVQNFAGRSNPGVVGGNMAAASAAPASAPSVPRRTRAPSAYNKFVADFCKKHPGKDLLKRASAAWKSQK